MPPLFGKPARDLVPVVLPEPLASDVDALLEHGDLTGAVRLVRERTGLGLTVAIRAVQARQRV